MKLTFEQAYWTYIKSGFPLLIVPTKEVDRATAVVNRLTDEWNEILLSKDLPQSLAHLKLGGYDIQKWNCIDGWIDKDGKESSPGSEKDAETGLQWLVEQGKAGVYIMENAHMFLHDEFALPKIVQLVRNQYRTGKQCRRHLFLIGDIGDIPKEFEHLAVLLDFPLPEADELEEYIANYTGKLSLPKKLSKETIREAAEAATGMTTTEVESAVCVAVVQSKGTDIDRDVVFEEKAKVVKKSNLIEHMAIDKTMAEIGGLEVLKEDAVEMSDVFNNLPEALAYGLKIPKGIMIAGVSGTGKTACGKALAHQFGVPLYHFDLGRMFGGHVGDTEGNWREAKKLFKAVAPAVVIMDEFEKALAGMMGSGSEDGGVSKRLGGSVLTWMQEKTEPIFVVATCNDITGLPPEVLRKGRFNYLYFVDLPSLKARLDIFKIHLLGTGRDLSAFKGWEKLAADKLTLGYTGAEIEAVVDQGLTTAFTDKKNLRREPTVKDIELAIKNTVPLVVTKGDEIRALRAWASNKARIAGAGDPVRLDKIKTPKEATVFFDDDRGVQAPAKRTGRGRANG